jgi:ketosteroid isomerase-like protein
MTDDVQAIKNLVYSYAELLDTGDLDGIGAMFERAGVRMSESDYEIRGSDAMRSLIADTVQLYDGIPRTKHVITNVSVEIDADGCTATARSYYTALQEHPDLPLHLAEIPVSSAWFTRYCVECRLFRGLLRWSDTESRTGTKPTSIPVSGTTGPRTSGAIFEKGLGPGVCSTCAPRISGP